MTAFSIRGEQDWTNGDTVEAGIMYNLQQGSDQIPLTGSYEFRSFGCTLDGAEINGHLNLKGQALVEGPGHIIFSRIPRTGTVGTGEALAPPEDVYAASAELSQVEMLRKIAETFGLTPTEPFPEPSEDEEFPDEFDITEDTDSLVAEPEKPPDGESDPE